MKIKIGFNEVEKCYHKDYALVAQPGSYFIAISNETKKDTILIDSSEIPALISALQQIQEDIKPSIQFPHELSDKGWRTPSIGDNHTDYEKEIGGNVYLISSGMAGRCSLYKDKKTIAHQLTFSEVLQYFEKNKISIE